MEIMDGLNAAADKESHVLGELSAKMTPVCARVVLLRNGWLQKTCTF